MAKTVLVTGAARGIGYSIAEKLASEGWHLAICDIRPETEHKEAMDHLRSYGVKVLYCQCDVSDSAARTNMLDAIIAEFGQINALVNNAGVAPAVRADILEATEASFERLMKINLQGPYFLTQIVARQMIEQKKAHPASTCYIVNISSISAEVASPSRGEYCISKAGVSMSTKLWSVRLGEYDIPVYEIRPGVIKTDMTASVQEKYDKMIANGLCLQARWGMPEDVGCAVAMLLRGDIHYSTGQVVNVDGGLTVQRL